jgi:hypothetical protein
MKDRFKNIITRYNYEEYFIDYIEGKLDAREEDELFQFLTLNPDLKKETDMMSDTSLSVEPGDEVFRNKFKLYKEKYDSAATFDYYAIAYTEGDLAKNEESEFINYLYNNPEKRELISLFNKSKLCPDETIIFHHKNKLYRHKKVKSFIIWTSGIAAALTIFLLIYRVSDNFINKSEVADNNFSKNSEEKNIVENDHQQPDAPIIVESLQIPDKDEKQIQSDHKPQPTETSQKAVEEIGQDQIQENKEVMIRKYIDVPLRIDSRSVTLAVEHPEKTPVPMHIINQNEANEKEERLLADRIREKTGFEKIQLDEAAKAGLSLISIISNDRLNFKTNNSGQITKLNLDTEILAVSIPVKIRKEK